MNFVPLQDYVLLSAVLFCIGILGMVVNRKNLITMLMCIELILLAANFNFVAFSQYMHHAVGEMFVFFILAIAAAESVIGLAILVVVYNNRKSINVDKLNELRG